MLVDLRPFNITGKQLQHDLDEVYITVNKNAIPNDPEKPFVTSGVRIGTPAVTTRGLVEEDMDVIAECIYLTATDFEQQRDKIRAGVTRSARSIPSTNKLNSINQRGPWGSPFFFWGFVLYCLIK